MYPPTLTRVPVLRRTACAVVSALVVGIVGAGCSIGNDVEADLETAREFNQYPLYWAGERFEELELSHVSLGGSAVGFIYGTCEITGDHGCAPPLQIQIFPLCFHLDVVAANQIWTHRRIRGTPVGVNDAAPVMFTQRTQIKVYGSDPGQELRALRALRSLNNVPPQIGPVDPIPPSAAAVLEGTAPCPH